MSKKIYNESILPFIDGMYRYAMSIVHEPKTVRDVVQDCMGKIRNLINDQGKVEKVNAWGFLCWPK